MTAKKTKPLTEKQKKFVDAKMEGRPVSVILGNTQDCEKSETVQAALRVAREELEDITTIKRVDVVEGILDAINRAKLAGEPATEISGWREIGKILGHYAPEVKKFVLSDDQDKIARKLESLSTQELLEMAAKKKQLTIDGYATRVN